MSLNYNFRESPLKQVKKIEYYYQFQQTLKNYQDRLNFLYFNLASLLNYEAQLKQEIAEKKQLLYNPQLTRYNYIHPTVIKPLYYQSNQLQKQSTIIQNLQNLAQQNSRKKKPFDFNLLPQKEKPQDGVIQKESPLKYQTKTISETQNENKKKNNDIIQIENIEKINQIVKPLEVYQLKTQFQYQEDRLKKTVQQIKNLKEKSQDQRHVNEEYKPYLREVGDQNTLFKQYSIIKLATKKDLKQHCNKIQFVRGDGNCFYTAFMYQFLVHLLFTYNLQEYDEFIQFVLINKIQFKINYKDFKIDDQELLEEFLYQLQTLRLIEQEKDRRQQLLQNFVQYQIQDNGQGCFNSLSTIFLRNLCNTLLEFNEMKDQCIDRQNLLIWEEECNYNEIVIQTLAVQLKIHIKLIFFENGGFIVQNYQEQQKNQIILLIQPGHYNIGIFEPSKD